MAEVGLHLLQTPQVILLHTLQDCTESELLGHLTIMDNLPPSSPPPLFCLRMNEETTLQAQTVYSRECITNLFLCSVLRTSTMLCTYLSHSSL